MKEFVVKNEPRASLKIGDKEFKFRSPTRGEALDFSKKAKESKEDVEKMVGLMDEVLCRLGDCSPEDLKPIPADMFNDLFQYLVDVDESKKK